MATSKTARLVAALLPLTYLALCAFWGGAPAGPPQGGGKQRVPWTGSRITGSPDPPLPYVTERVFPALTFNQCLDITHAPGSRRLFVVEMTGKIFSFPNEPDVQAADLVVDLAACLRPHVPPRLRAKPVLLCLLHPGVGPGRWNPHRAVSRDRHGPTDHRPGQ
jgi:hypothetical protein